MSNVINMGGGGIDLVTGTLKSGSHVIYSDGDVSHDEIPTADKSAQVLGNSIVYAPFGLTGGATAMSQAGFWLVTDDFTALEAYATASTTPKSGVTYTNGISDLTPDILSKFAAAISNNADITYDTEAVYCDLSSYHRKITVGDTIPISMDDRIHDFRIVGFNTEQLTDSAAYGSVTYTGKAGITFEMTDVYNNPIMYTYSFVEESWSSRNGTYMNSDSFIGKFPEIWKTLLVSVTHDAKGSMSSSDDDVFPTESISEKLFVLLSTEISGYSNGTEIVEHYDYTYSPIKSHQYKYYSKQQSILGSEFYSSIRKTNSDNYVPYLFRDGLHTLYIPGRGTSNFLMYCKSDESKTTALKYRWIGNFEQFLVYISPCFCL